MTILEALNNLGEYPAPIHGQIGGAERLRELQAIEHLVGLGYEVRFLSDVWFENDDLDAVRKEIAELKADG